MLDDVRVVEMADGIAASYCTKLLADAGADVVKVEPAGGDPMRRWSASGADLGAEDGAVFRFLNASKRSVVGDLEAAEVRDLVSGADLVVESLRPGAARVDDLQALNPALVAVSLSPFGRTGPWAERPATEHTLQAWCGSIASRGRPERPPLAAGGLLGEWIGGSFAAPAALAALLGARRSGRGDHVDVSLLECMTVTMNTYAYVFASFRGGKLGPGPPRAIEIPSIEPTRDGYVGICTITAQQFEDFLVLVERPDLTGDQSLKKPPVRMRRIDEMLGIIDAWTSRRTTEEVIEAATLLRIPVAPVGNGRSVLEMDHFRERGTFLPSADGGFTQPRVPYRVGDSPVPRPGPSPKLGEHQGRVSWPRRAGAETLDGEPEGNGEPDGMPLAGIRIADFTAFWAGPAGTHLLASLGAEVIKVESTRRPDGMRFTSTVPPNVEQWWEWGPVFQGANTNKKSVTLDLTRPEGVALAKRLIGMSDAVMENFTPRVMEGFGLDWPAVHGVNPRAVMVRMPGFGLSGPWRDRTGFAQTMEQVSGMAWVTGWEDGPPVLPRGPCDPMAGMHAAFSLLVALDEARRTGEGRLVEMTMVEVALNAAAAQVVEATAYGRLLGRAGNRGPGAAPQGVYSCGDERWLALSVTSDEEWKSLLSAMGDPAWGADPALSNAAGRRRAHDRIDGAIASWAAAQDLDEVVEALAARGVPAAPAVAPVEVVDNPQLARRGLLENLEHPVTGRHLLPGLPFRLSSHPGPWLYRHAPTLGQHNREILGDLLGLEADELGRLEEEGVTGSRPAGA